MTKSASSASVEVFVSGDTLACLPSTTWTTAQARNPAVEIGIAFRVLYKKGAELFHAVEARIQTDASVRPDNASSEDAFALEGVNDSLNAHKRNVS